MMKTRVIPCLLLKNGGLVKTIKFTNPKYLGDPINIIKIFNEKEVDELILLDIGAYRENREINYKIISDIASECFMPLSYGGGIKSIDDMQKLLKIGIEKISLNSVTIANPDLIREAVSLFGSSTIIVSVDVKKNFFGRYEVYIYGGKYNTKIDPVSHVLKMQDLGVGEVLINSINCDGLMNGYDTKLIELIASKVDIPVIACGGAGKLEHFRDAVEIGKASAVAAGSMFVFQGPHRAVLISYPSQRELRSYLK